MGRSSVKKISHERAHMDYHHVDSVHYEDKQARLNYLRTVYAPRRDRPEVFRTPGSFLAEFVFNGLKFATIVDFIRSNPQAMTGIGCMDERIKAMYRGNQPLVTSHDGCGAAGLVMKVAQDDPKVRVKLAAVIGTAELDTALATNNSDEIGKLWSKSLAKAAGADYAHLGVDHDHHYATMAVIDAAGCFLGETPGKVGERTFIVSNTEFLGNKDRGGAYQLMIQYGFLALEIARGGHSTLHGKTEEYPFTIVVTRDESFKQNLFESVLRRFLAEKLASGTDYAELNYHLEYLDEAQLAR